MASTSAFYQVQDQPCLDEDSNGCFPKWRGSFAGVPMIWIIIFVGSTLGVP